MLYGARGMNTSMKTLILLSLLSFGTQAADYSCLSGSYKYSLTTELESHALTITNFQSRETLYLGVVSEIIQDEEFTELYFELGGHQRLQLTFKTPALKEEVDVLYGISHGTYGGSAFKCYRKKKNL